MHHEKTKNDYIDFLKLELNSEFTKYIEQMIHKMLSQFHSNKDWFYIMMKKQNSFEIYKYVSKIVFSFFFLVKKNYNSICTLIYLIIYINKIINNS